GWGARSSSGSVTGGRGEGSASTSPSCPLTPKCTTVNVRAVGDDGTGAGGTGGGGPVDGTGATAAHAEAATDEQVRYEVAGHVATITLNRPDRLNAATFDMGEQLADAFARVESDAEVRSVVLTGAGRAFCAGDDVEAAWGDERMVETLRQLGGVRPPLTPEARL